MPRHRLPTLPTLLCTLVALLLCGAAGAGSASASIGSAAVRAQLGHEMDIAGSLSGAYVYDLTAKEVLYADRSGVMRAPASVEKLYTATTLLERMGPSTRLQTSVLGLGQVQEGVWNGNLYLRGGGDPSFGSSSFIKSHYGGQGASVSSLARQLVQVDGIHRVTGAIEGDESYFDSLRGEPSSGYRPDPFLEGTLSALSFNRGTSASGGAHAPAAYAARELWAALKQDGVSIGKGSGAASTPPGATQLAAVQSPTITQLLSLTLPPSDNFFAETLLKDLGARYAGAGTTPAGASVVRQTIATAFGIHPRLVDGSGLSRADASSPYQVVDLLGELSSTPTGAILRDDLAVAGETGTLSERMRHTVASGRCQAKTGTLIGDSNLAGYCEAQNGHLLAFAFFTDGISTAAAHLIQDNMTITLVRY